MKKILMVALLGSVLLLSSKSAFAQKKVKLSATIVENENNLPLQYATVSLLSGDDKLLTGVLSDDKGAFEFEVAPNANYKLSITFVGFAPYKSELIKMEDQNLELGLIKMIRSAEIAGVEIQAERKFVTNSIDRKSYEVADLQVTEGGNISEVLQIIPSVAVDIDGNISLRGNENVVILIDGKPSGMSSSDAAAYFQAMPAGAIQRIEVITNPSAKYDPDGMMGMINIVTKTNKYEGINGNVKVSLGNGPNINTSAMLMVKKGKWNAMLNLGYNTRNGTEYGETHRETTGDSLPVLDQINDGNRIMSGFMSGLNATYSFNQNNSLKFNASLSQRNMQRTEGILYKYSHINGGLIDAFGRESDGGGLMNMGRFGLDYTHKFKAEGRNLSLGLMRSIFDGTFGSDYIEFDYDNDLNPLKNIVLLDQRQSSPNLRYGTTLQLDYVHPLKKNNAVELGYKSIFNDGTSNISSEIFDHEQNTWVNEPSITNNFQLKEQIHSVYGVYKQNIKKFGYQVGLRAEKAVTDAELITTKELFHNDYLNLFPSAHISYWLPKAQQIKASYSRRINRPHGRQLNPFADYSDPQNIRKGNPFLYPEYINSVEVEYSKIWKKHTFNSSLYFKQVNGMISRVKIVADGVSTVTYLNAGTGTQYGLEASWNANFTKWWTLIASMNAFNMVIDGVEADLSSEGYSLNTKLMSTFTLPKSYSLQVSANYNSPKVVPQGQVGGMHFVDFSVNKKVLKGKGSLSLRGTDIFNTREYVFTTSGLNFYQDSYRKRQSRFMYIGFSYNFGQYKERGMSRGIRGSGGGDGAGETEAEID